MDPFNHAEVCWGWGTDVVHLQRISCSTEGPVIMKLAPQLLTTHNEMGTC